MAFKPLARELDALFDLSDISLHQSADDFEMKRFFPVIVWVEAKTPKDTRRIFDHVISTSASQLKANGFSEVKGAVWGPFKGSRFGGIFGRSKDEPNGRDFRSRLKKLQDGIAKNIGPIKKGAKILIIVGGAAITIVGGPAAAATVIHVPVLVTKGIAAAGTLLSASGALKKIFEKKPDTPTSPAATKTRKIDLGDEETLPRDQQPREATPKEDSDDGAKQKEIAENKRKILKERKSKPGGPDLSLRPKR